MITDITLPKLGVEMETALLTEWIAAEGDEVAAGDVIVNLETEKVVFELDAPTGGFLHIVAEADAEYAIGDRLGALAGGRAEYEELVAGGGAPAAATVDAAPAPAPSPGDVPAPQGRDAVAAARQGRRTLVSPLARRIAEANGIDLDAVAGSGPRGAIRRRDVEQAIAAGAAAGASAAPRTAAPVAADAGQAATAADAAPRAADAPRSQTIPMSSMRRTIAARMHDSIQSTAQMTDVREHDVTALAAFRAGAVAREGQLGFKLSFTALFAKAAVMALRVAPLLNARLLNEREIERYDQVNLGMAVAIPDGLLVPVVHDAERLSLRQLDEALTGVIGRARDRTASPQEIAGGTFTITNFGSFGSHFGTPILMPPQVAILGIGAMLERPVVRDGQLAVGKTMHTSLTVDHRVIDGETAGAFQNELARLFAEPDLLLYG